MSNKMSYNLKDYLYLINDFLDQSTCKEITKKISKLNYWEKHSYYDPITNQCHSYSNDLSVIHALDIPEIRNINEKLIYVIKSYINKLNFSWYSNFTNYTPIRLNKYDKNTEMKIHCDHIHSLFDGKHKGIPILTILGSLNNNYKGGELIMFNEQIIELKAGNLLIFPSNFLYPHKVNQIISGTRYSYVSWCW